MSNYQLILIVAFFLLNSTSSKIIINIKTKRNGTFSTYIDDPTAIVKVNNKTVNYSKSYYLRFQCEPGEIEIIINKNLTQILFSDIAIKLNNYIDSIKIKALDASITSMDKMLRYSESLTSVDLSEFDISKVTDFGNMFFGCDKLVYVKFGNYTTKNAKNMTGMFNGCINLKYVNLDNFDTTLVTDMNRMFKDCQFLEYLNISSFKGTNVSTTDEMFSGCNSLISLDFNNFEATNITSMNNMFYSCFNLKSLNLSQIYTSKTTNMDSMFCGCKSLTYLNINNFYTSKVTKMNNMFQDCSSLISLNLSNFQITSDTAFENIFEGISENIIFCANETLYEIIKSDMDNKKCAIWDNNCIPDWSKKSKKIINDNGICIDKCNETENYKYEYENKCYSSCPIGTTSLYNKNFFCEIFNDNVYQEYIKKNQNIESTNIIPTSDFKDINTDSINKDENKIQIICQPNGFFKNECNISKYNSMIDMIIHDISKGLMNDIIDNIINNTIDSYKIYENIKYQITSSFNQKNKIYENISSINLHQCEDKLKSDYGIPPNSTLIIFKYDYISDKALIPIVGYEVKKNWI